MKIKGDTIREGKALLAGRLYRTEAGRTIAFEEEDTRDTVYINFCLKDGQYGIYGKEYKPPFVEDNGGKKADILALAVDENQKKFSSWIFDVKKTVGGEDVIYHLVEQLAESMKHKNSIAVYLDGYQETVHMGYITHELQKERILEAVEKKRNYLKVEKEKIKNLPMLIGNAARLKLLAEEAKWKVLHSFSDGYMEIGKKKYGLECYISTEQDNGFVCTLDVTCG